MARLEFVFSYKVERGQSELDAYDASQALYGIARSLAITTNYVMHGKVIKQAPSLKGARVLITPPKTGSFEFIAPVVDFSQTPGLSAIAILAATLPGNLLSDLTRLLYRRLSGLSEDPQTSQVNDLLKTKANDIDSLTDALNEDVIRLHRPVGNRVRRFNAYTDIQKLGDFDERTKDYATTKVLGKQQEQFIGNVSSLNGNTFHGRFYLRDEKRTVGFHIDKNSYLDASEKRLLSWSLNRYINEQNGDIKLIGRSLSSKQNLLKHIFLTDVQEG